MKFECESFSGYGDNYSISGFLMCDGRGDFVSSSAGDRDETGNNYGHSSGNGLGHRYACYGSGFAHGFGFSNEKGQDEYPEREYW